MHGHRFGNVALDIPTHAYLRGCEGERQRRPQFLIQAAGSFADQLGRPQQIARSFALQLRQLLRQQLFGLEALPGRVAVVVQLRQRDIRRRVVQK